MSIGFLSKYLRHFISIFVPKFLLNYVSLVLYLYLLIILNLFYRSSVLNAIDTNKKKLIYNNNYL